MGFGDPTKKQKAAEKMKAERAAKEKAKEDAYWEDSDKHVKAKEERAKEKEEKHDAKLADKEEKRILEQEEEQENTKVSGYNKKHGGVKKITQAEIARNAAMMAALNGPGKGGYAGKSAKTVVVDQPALRPNPNHLDDEVEATGVDNALKALSAVAIGEEDAATPASRMKYKDYEANILPRLKEENPGLKMTQLKDKAWKSWERAPENPKNMGL